MAGEISLSSQFRFSRGYLTDAISANATIDCNTASPSKAGGCPLIPTTAAGTALSLGSLTTPGMSFLKNLDATNYVEVGIQTGGAFYPLIKLKPGEFAPFRLSTLAPYARAHTAACLLEYEIYDD